MLQSVGLQRVGHNGATELNNIGDMGDAGSVTGLGSPMKEEMANHSNYKMFI